MEAEVNIIGDVAGQYRTLIALMNKMPSAPIVLLGDIVDRGPDSAKVVAWAREHQDCVKVLKGNHEHMMIDFILDTNKRPKYAQQDWFVNGGGATVRSYFKGEKYTEITIPAMKERLKEDAFWMMGLDLFDDSIDGLLLSHTPWCVGTFPAYCDQEMETLWYRGQPLKVPGRLSVHGHNARDNVKWFRPEPWPFETPAPPYAVNIDTSRNRVLTGLHWPSLEIFAQEYLE